MTPKLKSPLPPYNTWNCRWYDKKYDCARDRACISRNNRMVTILANPRQTTLSLSRTRSGPDQRPQVDSRQQRRRAHKIGRRIRCNSIRARRDCGMTTTTSRRRKNYQAITWFVPVHLFLFSIYARISIEETCFSPPRRKDTLSRGSYWWAGTVSVRGWCCCWLCASSSGPASSSLCSPLESSPPRALARHRDNRHGDSTQRHSTRPHTYFHVYIYVYILRPIYNNNLTFFSIKYLHVLLFINIYYFTFNVAFAKRILFPNDLSPNQLQLSSFIKIRCAYLAL